MTARLRKLQAQIDEVRNRLGFSGRGEIIFLAARDSNDEIVVVEADGFGGAITRVVEGNYPLDYFTCHEKAFAKEGAAVIAAEGIAESSADAAEVLG
jgi:hypothetical protein